MKQGGFVLSKNKKNPCPGVTKYVEYVNNNIDKIANNLPLYTRNFSRE